MMRWVLFSVAVVALTALATVGATYLIPEDSPAEHVHVAPPKEEFSGPTGQVEVVGGLKPFNFGIMPQRTEGSHEWTVVNKGAGPVKLTDGGATCSCTNGSIPKGKSVTLAPGETFPMVVNWNTKTWDPFHQVVTVIVANDPATPRLEFVVDGTAKPPVLTLPNADTKLEFQSVENDKPHSLAVGLGSLDRPDLKVTGVKANPELFSTEVVPLSAEECKALKVGKGSRVTVTVKPGAPIGPFNEELVVLTDHPLKPEVRFGMAGKVEGPIRFSPENVRMFVPAKEGGEQELTFWVRGRKDTKFTVMKKPEALDVAIAPLASVGGASQYKFTVRIPAGRPVGTHFTDTIILKTDHPQAAEVKIPVTVFLRAS